MSVKREEIRKELRTQHQEHQTQNVDIGTRIKDVFAIVVTAVTVVILASKL